MVEIVRKSALVTIYDYFLPFDRLYMCVFVCVCLCTCVCVSPAHPSSHSILICCSGSYSLLKLTQYLKGAFDYMMAGQQFKGNLLLWPRFMSGNYMQWTVCLHTDLFSSPYLDLTASWHLNDNTCAFPRQHHDLSAPSVNTSSCHPHQFHVTASPARLKLHASLLFYLSSPSLFQPFPLLFPSFLQGITLSPSSATFPQMPNSFLPSIISP